MIEPEYHERKVNRKDIPGIEWSNASCGISTFYCLSISPKHFVAKILRPRKNGDRPDIEAFVLFSDVVGYAYYTGEDGGVVSFGVRIARFIKEHPELGPIIETESRINPNTGNLIKAWIWAPDRQSALSREAIFSEGIFKDVKT